MKIKYQSFKFSAGSLSIIAQANRILTEYSNRGLIVTLRQLYYQFVARDLIPNKQTEYKRLGSIINDARLAGMIDWEYLQDRTRNLSSLPHWRSPGHIIHDAAAGYHTDLWHGQRNYVEVWIEKDALLGVIEDVCRKYDVPFFSCRGYTSQSEMWSAAVRMNREEDGKGKLTHIIHLGDHDPSGKDMSRDIQDRMELFGSEVIVHRIALNMDQVEMYNPPPNPAKITDSQAQSYIAEYGDESWELDALDPDTLTNLIEDNIRKYLDEPLIEKRKKEQEEQRGLLELVSDRWEEVVNMITDEGGEE